MHTTTGSDWECNPRGEHRVPHWGGRGEGLTLSMPRDKISLSYVQCMKTGVGVRWAAGLYAG